MTRICSALAITMLAFGCSAGGSSSDLQLPDNVDCNGTPPSFEQVTALTKCATCHSSAKTGAQRANAPAGVDFDTAALADAHAEQAASEVNKGAMPPASSGITLTDGEMQQLYAWALCRM